MIELVTVSNQPKLWFGSAPSKNGGEPHGVGLKSGADPVPKKILIVEDEFFIALDAQAQVEALGHTVVGIAVSADQAVLMAEREKPDLVLMDIRLSGARDGIDAAIEIRDRHGIESIFVTANTDPVTLQRAQATYPLGILHKPLTQARLLQKLSQIKWK
jgi:CheY-like chemotaxis protein